jgi:zinc D-Ala-D-Ala carboxypeptidase
MNSLKNMGVVASEVFEPLREWVGGPIKINSFFRCYKLNKAIGGSKTSQHMSGQAMDIDDTFGWKTNTLRCLTTSRIT